MSNNNIDTETETKAVTWTSLSKSQYRARAPLSEILATSLVVLKHCNIGFGILDCCLIQANLPLFILAHMVDWAQILGGR